MPTLTVGKTEIPYTIRRSPRVTRQRIIVTPKDVEVVAPIVKSFQEVEAFVQSRRRWIYDEREKMREILASNPWPDHFVTGAKIPYRGRRMPLTVRAIPAHTFRTGYRNGFHVDYPKSMPDDERDEKIKYVLELWLRRRMENDSLAFVRRYSRKLGQEPKAVRIKDQKHLWGSCGKDRIINLNWRLIFMPKPILEYVVVHELCHLVHRHHSTAFWGVVKTVLPGYERQKAWLEQYAVGLDL